MNTTIIPIQLGSSGTKKITITPDQITELSFTQVVVVVALLPQLVLQAKS